MIWGLNGIQPFNGKLALWKADSGQAVGLGCKP